MIETVLAASPLFWPGVLCSLVLALLLSRRAGRLLRSHRAVGFMLVLTLGGIITLTLLPDTRLSLSDNVKYALQECSFTGGPHPLSELLTPTQSSLNVALFVPLGLSAALAGTKARAAVAALAAATLPVVIETVQYELPVLGRACDAQDVWDNSFGLAIGLLVGLAVGPVLRAVVRARRGRAGRRHTGRPGAAPTAPGPAGGEAVSRTEPEPASASTDGLGFPV